MRHRFLSYFLIIISAVLASGASHEPWPSEQPVEVSASGLSRIVLTPETFDSALPDLSDLRLLDPNAAEVPFVIERALPDRSDSQKIKDPVTTQDGRLTRITIPIQRAEQLRSLRLESPARSLLKAVSIEGIERGGNIQTVIQREVIYRQDGAEHLTLSLGNLSQTIQTLRISLDDSRTSPIPITEIVLFREQKTTIPPVASPSQILNRLEGTGESRLIVEMPGARLPLVGIRFEVDDPVFLRKVKLLVREWENGELRDRVLGAGSIHRVQLAGTDTGESLEIGVSTSPDTREIVLSFENGDSPPLNVRSVVLLSEPIQLAFLAKTVGVHRLLSGNPEARPVRYDLASLTEPLRSATSRSLATGRLVPRTEYRRPQGLTDDIPRYGGTFSPSAWRFTRPVSIGAEGVQRLELPLHALSSTRTDRADVRLVSEGRQVLYVQERGGYFRALDLVATPVKVSNRPQVSRWLFKLPQPKLPLRSIRVEIATTLFDRDLRLVEERGPGERSSDLVELGHARWMRTPDRQDRWFEIGFSGVPRSDTIWLETDNGDNAPVEILKAKAVVPTVQLLFQAKEEEPLTLYYGNPEAQLPRYDLSLVAPRILAARKHEANVADADPTSASPNRADFSSWLFYGALALVVVGLGWVISRLVPKSKPQ